MARINLDVTEFGFNSKNTAQYALTVLLGFDSVYYNIVDEANQVLVISITIKIFRLLKH